MFNQRRQRFARQGVKWHNSIDFHGDAEIYISLDCGPQSSQQEKIKSNCEYGEAGICLTSSDFEKVTDKVDSVIAYSMIYLEFQKAFNKVPHDRHLFKLKATGIQDKTWK